MKKLIIILLLTISTAALAADLQITFQPPTQRADGSPLSVSEIGYFSVYVDGVKDAQQVPATATTAIVTGLDKKVPHDIQMTTTDTAGRESVLSAAVQTQVVIPDPKPGVIQRLDWLN